MGATAPHKRLHSLLDDLIAAGYEPPPYRTVYEGARDRRFPALQVNGIWHYDPAMVPAIAAALGLTPASRSAA